MKASYFQGRTPNPFFMHFDRKELSNEQLKGFFKSILLPRMIEEKMLLLLRQGKISKWFSGIGQEAISVGTTLALENNDWIMPLHRNLGVFTTRNMPLDKLFMQWQGSYEGYSKGRERSFHFGSTEHHICGMISHLGPQLALADGAALASKLAGEKRVAVAFTGEGGTSEGDFHEALNVAAVWDLPVIFIIENNGYALSTPTHEQFRSENLVDRARGYGMQGVKIDGNNLLSVYDTIKGVREFCLEHQKPFLIECSTFRMRGHEEASGTKYVPQYLFEIWEKRDPVRKYLEWLLKEEIISQEEVISINEELREYIDHAISKGLSAPAIQPDTREELQDIFKPYSPGSLFPPAQTERRFRGKIVISDDSTKQYPEKRFIDAISEALENSLDKFPKLVIMGQDIAEYGGAFKITEGFVEKYGKDRIRNTPLCESAIIGTALGLSLEGYKSVVEMQFADFVSSGFNQIVNNLAKIHYRWGQNADVVVRMPTGAGVGAGPYHSQSNEAWFMHTPGLKVVYPSNPYDAKGLLNAAISDPNPVMFFEHKALYRSVVGPVPDEYYEIEIGKAGIVQEGDDITIITYGAGVHWAKEAAQINKDLSIYILDLRSLSPLDYDAIRTSVMHTGKVLILHEDTLIGGIGGEISAWITENCFSFLDAPVLRCASLDTPVPFNMELEKNFLAKSRLQSTIDKLSCY
jgi:2-oxoisovalerate dehydrogenase E1 component